MKRLDSLTGLRFYAAFAVLLRHSVLPLIPDTPILPLAVIGPVGVGFFFVVSGFVLTWSWRPDHNAQSFLLKRTCRIYPMHALTTLLVVLASEPHPGTWKGTALSLLLLHAWLPLGYFPGGNIPSWSLSCEAFFYACFPTTMRRLAKLSARQSVVVAIGGMFVLVIATAAWACARHFGLPFSEWVSTYTNPVYRFGEFVIGMALGWALRQGWRPPISAKTAIVGSCLYYIGLAYANSAIAKAGLHVGGESGLPLGVLDLGFLPCVVVLVSAIAASDIDGRPLFLSNRAHVALGQWSFSLYLLQGLIIEGSVSFASNASFPFRIAVWCATIAVAILAAAVAYHAFEQPIERTLRRVLRLETGGSERNIAHPTVS